MAKLYKYKVGHKTDAGLDFNIGDPVAIPAGSCMKIRTNLEGLNIPSGYAGFVSLRSKHCELPIVVYNPPIDAHYTGPVHLWVRNLSDRPIVLDGNIDYFQVYVVKIRPWYGKKIAGKKIGIKSKEKRGFHRDTTR